MKNITRSFICFLFLGILSLPLAAQNNVAIFGIKNNNGVLLYDQPSHPITKSIGIFYQNNLKRIALNLGIAYGTRSSYSENSSFVFNARAGGMLIESFINSTESYFTADFTTKIPIFSFQKRSKFFLGIGVQSRRGIKIIGNIKSNSFTNAGIITTTRRLNANANANNYVNINFSGGMDYYLDKNIFLSGQIGWSKYYQSSNTDFNREKTLDNIFFELQVGYIFQYKKKKQ